MGTLFTVMSLEPKVVDWLKDIGVAVPSWSGHSRGPTPAEIRQLLESSDQYEAEIRVPEIGGTWQASIERRHSGEPEWALLNITGYRGEDVSHNLSFKSSSEPVALEVLRKLVRSCGPLVIVPDSGEDPVVITNEGAT